MPHTAVIALGSNLSQPQQQVRAALDELAALPGCRLLQASSLYLSAPVGYTDQPDFVNAVCLLETGLEPQALLSALHGIEAKFGRERTFRNAPRTLDLDILLYDDIVLHDERLTVPHPRMQERAFVLRPLQELDARLVGAEHLAAVADQRITVAQNAQWAASALHG